MRLQDKVAIVTGGGAGIGRGIIECLSEEGATVAVVDLDYRNAQKAVDEIKGHGHAALAVAADVSDSKQADKAIQNVLAALGRIDILVNNVGGEARYYNERPGQSYSEEQEWDDTVRLNLKTTMLMCHAVAPLLVKQKSGKIVNIASIAGRAPSGNGARSSGMGGQFSPMMSYAVAKAGVIQFTRILALQLAEYNVNC